MSEHIIGESGRIDISNTLPNGVVETINFRGIYNDPVVVALIVTWGENDPVDVRVRNVSSTSCEIFLEEPQDDGHATETVCYIVMEKGRFTIDNGLTIEAGSHSTNSVHRSSSSGWNFDTVSFSSSFSDPIVVATLNSYNNGEFISSQVGSVTSNDFGLAQEAVETGSSVTTEDIAWIAFETGTFENIDVGYNVDGSNDGYDNTPHTINFNITFSLVPDVMVDGITANGSQGYWTVGAGTWNTTTIEVYAEEDLNANRSHADNTFGWIAVPENTNFKLSTYNEADQMFTFPL